MIAKISSSENLGGVLGYNFKKVEKKEASVLFAHDLYQNINGEYKMEDVLNDMQTLIPNKCRTRKIVFHCSLNPHPDEKLSDEKLIQIAKDYMEALGYGEQPYIVFKHNDIAREHIHIVSLRVNSKGQKINDKFEKIRSKKITDDLENKYNLIRSSKIHERVHNAPPKVDAEKDNLKEQIRDTMLNILKRYHFCSLGELNAILTKYNLIAEEVKTEYRGKTYDGIVYCVINDKGEKITPPIKASKIGRGVGYSAINNRIKNSKYKIKDFIPSIRDKVDNVMKDLPPTEEQLTKKLSEEGIRLLIRKTAEGRIYGITFIDDENGVAINGSRLGKGYSANAFNRYFSDNNQKPLTKTPIKLKETQEKQSNTTNTNQVTQTQTKQLNNDYSYTQQEEGAISEIFNAITSQNDDWKETAWQRKLRNKHNRLAKRQLKRKR